MTIAAGTRLVHTKSSRKSVGRMGKSISAGTNLGRDVRSKSFPPIRDDPERLSRFHANRMLAL